MDDFAETLCRVKDDFALNQHADPFGSPVFAFCFSSSAAPQRPAQMCRLGSFMRYASRQQDENPLYICETKLEGTLNCVQI